MDWADDITYSVHDVEDFYRAGRVPLHLLADRRYDKERRGFFEKAFARHPDKKGIWADQKSLEEAFNEVTIGLFPLEGVYTGEWSERAALRGFTSELIGRYVSATTIELKGGNPQLRIDEDRELEVAMLKELTWVYVIEAPELASQQEGQRQVIENSLTSIGIPLKASVRNICSRPTIVELSWIRRATKGRREWSWT